MHLSHQVEFDFRIVRTSVLLPTYVLLHLLTVVCPGSRYVRRERRDNTRSFPSKGLSLSVKHCTILQFCSTYQFDSRHCRNAFSRVVIYPNRMIRSLRFCVRLHSGLPWKIPSEAGHCFGQSPWRFFNSSSSLISNATKVIVHNDDGDISSSFDDDAHPSPTSDTPADEGYQIRGTIPRGGYGIAPTQYAQVR